MSSKQQYSVLLDTSFILRLLSDSDPLHNNAMGYYKYFLDNKIGMMISTISIAEYCVKGDISEIPLRTIRVVPFNINHATVAGKFAKDLYDARHAGEYSVDNRLIIPNDTKLFAQATIEKDIKYFVTSDTKAETAINTISKTNNIGFKHMDISTPYGQRFGVLEGLTI